MELPVAPTIAGSDSGGGAGMQADFLTFAANGVFGTTVITCLTAQNPDGVSAITAMEPGFLRAQAEQVAAFFKLRAIKTGMLFGGAVTRFNSRRITGVDTHGSGCTLSAAIAAQLAHGLALGDAVAAAHAYLGRSLAAALDVGGRKFINHFP